MKHAASVRPEPGSNSPLSESLFVRYVSTAFDSFFTLALLKLVRFIIFLELTSFFVFSYSVFNVLMPLSIL